MKSERATERVSEWLWARKKWNIWWHNDIHGPCLIIWCVILYVYVSLQKCINLFDILCELQFFVRIAIGFQGVRSFIVASYGLVVQLPHGLRQPNTYTHRERKKRCVVLGSCMPICVCLTYIRTSRIVVQHDMHRIQLLLLPAIFIVAALVRSLFRLWIFGCVCKTFDYIWL